MLYVPLPVCNSLFYFPGRSGPKRDEVTGGWRKLYNVELHNLYASPDRMIKSRSMRWARNAARMVLEEEFMQGFDGKARRKETARKS
jgi:hypothetical protein